LSAISFNVNAAEVFGLLGPNGGGKSTLFRILSTCFPPTAGRAAVLGKDVVTDAAQVRQSIGVVFQSPSLDKKLTAAENLRHHGHLYGNAGRSLAARIDESLKRVGLSDRANDRVERLSGGQQRRVELAKGLLHQPRVLLMDEPSTGLDPGARRDLWDHLQEARTRDGVSILLTTHLMDEAERCDRVGIMHLGKLVALGTPRELTASLGGEVVWLDCSDAAALARDVEQKLNVAATVVDHSVRIEHDRGHELVPRLFESFPGAIRSVTVRQPSLEDVFVQRTGQRYSAQGDLVPGP
jgi:ABC-2 type transport system ATP-binding protein